MTFAAEEAGQILSQDARGRVLVSRERRESLLEEYDRSGMSGVKFAQYVGMKYSTLAYWLQSRRRHRRREKLLLKAGAKTEAGQSNGGWIEAVVENASGPRVPAGALRINFLGRPTVRSAARLSVAVTRRYLAGVSFLPGVIRNIDCQIRNVTAIAKVGTDRATPTKSSPAQAVHRRSACVGRFIAQLTDQDGQLSLASPWL